MTANTLPEPQFVVEIAQRPDPTITALNPRLFPRPSGYLGVEDHPVLPMGADIPVSGFVGAYDWLASDQSTRADLAGQAENYNALPNVRDMHPDTLSEYLQTSVFAETDVQEEIKRYRGYQELFDLFSTDYDAFDERYDSLSKDEQSAYLRWENIHQDVIEDALRADSSMRGVPEWEELYALLVAEPDLYTKYTEDVMTQAERNGFHRWEANTSHAMRAAGSFILLQV